LLPIATPSLNHRTRHLSSSARDSFPPLRSTASTRSFEKPDFFAPTPFAAIAAKGTAAEGSVSGGIASEGSAGFSPMPLRIQIIRGFRVLHWYYTTV
jgi:hypothetical protein